MKLICGNREVTVHDWSKVVICTSAVGCSMVEGNDLFDLGFRSQELNDDDLIIQCGTSRITIECVKSADQRRLDRSAARGQWY